MTTTRATFTAIFTTDFQTDRPWHHEPDYTHAQAALHNRWRTHPDDAALWHVTCYMDNPDNYDWLPPFEVHVDHINVMRAFERITSHTPPKNVSDHTIALARAFLDHDHTHPFTPRAADEVLQVIGYDEVRFALAYGQIVFL